MKINLLYLAVLMILFSCKKTMVISENESFQRVDFHDQTMGSSARDLLDDRVYKFLTIEIQYMPGFRPEPATIDYLSNFLDTYLNKPKGIKVLLKEINSTDKDALSKDEVLGIEKGQRTQFAGGDSISIYVLFTDGIHPGKKILGMAYRNTSAVVYGKAVNSHSNVAGKLTRHELETAVLLHEIGHLLGLVNKGTTPQTDHVDHKHPDHCDNKKCLMYHLVETKSLSSIQLKGNIPVFDAHCINDLIANGGRQIPDFKQILKTF